MRLRINESALSADVIDMFRSAFIAADDYVEFWYNMSEDQIDSFKKLGIPIKELYAELSKCVQKDAEQERYKYDGDVSEIYNYKVNTLHDVTFEFVTARSDGWQADANAYSHVRVRDDRDVGDRVIVHELGHIVLNQNRELYDIVLTNQSGVFGKLHKVSRGVVKFEGVYGTYNSEEAFADSFSYFLCNPNNLKSNYPKVYEVMRKFTDNNKNIKQWVDRQIDRYHEALATQGGDEL